MSRSALIRRFLGDGHHDFALRIGECEELQETFGCGLHQLRERCADISIREIRAVLRLGLIGGGLDKRSAAQLAEREVIPGNLVEVSLLADEVINAAVAGVPEEPPGEPKGGVTGAPLSQTDSSDMATTTGPAAS